MGDYPTATLFYGIVSRYGGWFDDEPKAPWSENNDGMGALGNWEEAWVKRIGKMPESATFENMQQALKENPPGVELDQYGSYEAGVPYIAIKESIVTTTWEENKVIPIDRLSINLAWRATLQRFCEVMGIPWQDPAWHLVAFYG